MGIINIGITGHNGFIGEHLYNTISLLKDDFCIIPFEDKAVFDEQDRLERWVKKCDVIIHLAALNRHPQEDYIYHYNIDLVTKLLTACETTGSTPHILFSSSTQENRENLYGKSKRICRELIQKWSIKCGGNFTGLIIPNVFGPFGKPFYNSVVATFSYQLCNGLQPTIDNDSIVSLIYVQELVDLIIKVISDKIYDPELNVKSTHSCNVSDILNKLNRYKVEYLEQSMIPELGSIFERNLFNTFRSFIDYAKHFPISLKENKDNRGAFTELIKLGQGGQVSFSTTFPGIVRGNHFHIRKIERFVVIKGKALIELRKYNTNEKIELFLDGDSPSFVDMPIWYSHNIKNIGQEDLYTVFWINEFFDPKDSDTFFEVV